MCVRVSYFVFSLVICLKHSKTTPTRHAPSAVKTYTNVAVMIGPGIPMVSCAGCCCCWVLVPNEIPTLTPLKWDD